MKFEIQKSKYRDKEHNYHQICSSNSRVYIGEKYKKRATNGLAFVKFEFIGWLYDNV